MKPLGIVACAIVCAGLFDQTVVRADYDNAISINISGGGNGDVTSSTVGAGGVLAANWINTNYSSLRGAPLQLTGSTSSGDSLANFRVSLYTGGWGSGGAWENTTAAANSPGRSGWTLGTMPNGWGDVRQDISITGVPNSFLALGYDVYALAGPDYNSLAWTKMNTAPLTTAASGALTGLSPASSYHVGAAYQVMAIAPPPVAYWTGVVNDGVWTSAANFSSDVSGLIPWTGSASTADVVFNATTVQGVVNSILGVNQSI